MEWLSYSTYTPGAAPDGSDFTFSWKDDFTSFNSTRWSKADWTFDGNLVDFSPNNAEVISGKLVLSLTPAAQTGFAGTAPTGICGSVLGLEDQDAVEKAFRITYLPEKSNFIFEPISNEGTVMVRDMEGRLVFEGQGKASFGADFKRGCYLCTITTGGRLITKKIFKY